MLGATQFHISLPCCVYIYLYHTGEFSCPTVNVLCGHHKNDISLVVFCFFVILFY